MKRLSVLLLASFFSATVWSQEEIVDYNLFPLSVGNQEGELKAGSFSPDSKFLLSYISSKGESYYNLEGDNIKSFQIWNADTGELLNNVFIDEKSRGVARPIFSPSGKYVVIPLSNRILLWDTNIESFSNTINFSELYFVDGLILDDKEEVLLSTTMENRDVLVWSTKTGTKLARITPPFNNQFYPYPLLDRLSQVALSDNKNMLAIVDYKGSIAVWNLNDSFTVPYLFELNKVEEISFLLNYRIYAGFINFSPDNKNIILTAIINEGYNNPIWEGRITFSTSKGYTSFETAEVSNEIYEHSFASFLLEDNKEASAILSSSLKSVINELGGDGSFRAGLTSKDMRKSTIVDITDFNYDDLSYLLVLKGENADEPEPPVITPPAEPNFSWENFSLTGGLDNSFPPAIVSDLSQLEISVSAETGEVATLFGLIPQSAQERDEVSLPFTIESGQGEITLVIMDSAGNRTETFLYPGPANQSGSIYSVLTFSPLGEEVNILVQIVGQSPDPFQIKLGEIFLK